MIDSLTAFCFIGLCHAALLHESDTHHGGIIVSAFDQKNFFLIYQRVDRVSESAHNMINLGPRKIQ